MLQMLHSEEEARQALGVGRSTLFELMRTGELESVKIGRRRLIPAEALTDYVARLREGNRAAA